MDRLDNWQEKLQSEVVTFPLKPLSLVEYLKLSDGSKKAYLKELRGPVYRATIPQLAEMLGCATDDVKHLLADNGIPAADQGRRRTGKQEETWLKFLQGAAEPVDEEPEPPVEVPGMITAYVPRPSEPEPEPEPEESTGPGLNILKARNCEALDQVAASIAAGWRIALARRSTMSELHEFVDRINEDMRALSILEEAVK